MTTSKELLFKRMNNALLDTQASTSQTYEQHFLTLARLLADPSLASLNERLTSDLDLERFLEEGYRSQGSMMGSARLAWPEQPEDALGLKWLLIQKFAREPREILGFAHTFYTVGRSFTGELNSLTRQLLIPFVRDYKDFIMMVEDSEGPDAHGVRGAGTARAVPPQVTYNISAPVAGQSAPPMARSNCSTWPG